MTNSKDIPSLPPATSARDTLASQNKFSQKEKDKKICHFKFYFSLVAELS